MPKPLSPKAVDKHISKLYAKACHGMSINIMKIPTVFHIGKSLWIAGASDVVISAAMFDYVKNHAK